MTESTLQKLEDKILALLKEMESMQNEVSQLRRENAALKTEKINSTQKLQDLLSLMDAMDNQPLVNGTVKENLELMATT